MTAETWAMVLALPVLLYAVYIAAHAVGWHRARRRYALATDNAAVQPPVAVLVPARNEEANLRQNLPRLLQQGYGAFEVVVVDDFSEDATAHMARTLAAGRASIIQSVQPGKKAALATGVAAATAPWLVTTDADCVPASSDWLQRLLAARGPQTQCIAGPLRKTHGLGLFGRIQALESAGLVGLAGGAIGLGRPTLANGANLAFARSAFDAVGGYHGIDHVASGDDELLLHKIAGQYGSRAIGFAAHPDAVVDTPAERRLPELLRQRLRWVSKSRAYTNPFIRWGQVLAYVAYVALLALTVLAVVQPRAWPMAVAAWGLKVLAELAVLYPATALLRQRYLLWLLPLYQLPYLVYVLFIGVAGSVIKTYTWKGRRVH